MTKLLLTSIMVAAVCLALGGWPQERSKASEADSQRAKISAVDLANSIKDKLATDPRLKTADLDVNADANDNQVTLAGVVACEDLRLQAVEMAKSAQPNLRITDNIQVQPPPAPRSSDKGK